MTRKQARLYGLLLFLAGAAVAVGLIMYALSDNISYFRTPTEIATGAYPEHGTDHSIRLGGLVENGSLKHEGGAIIFRVTDFKNSVTIRYDGVVPDLFREGQGVVATGRIGADGIFQADQLLAKHDEKYKPPEIERALKQGGAP